MLTMPEFAFLALCRLAKPLASPGPRCSSVEAGVPFIRKYPSAAPVTTPSNRPSTQRMPSTRSSAATKCISDVPGLAKQTSTPPATRVRTRLSAPFIIPLPFHPARLSRNRRSIIVRDGSQRAKPQCSHRHTDNIPSWLTRVGYCKLKATTPRWTTDDDVDRKRLLHAGVDCETRLFVACL